jgi:hydrogenase maturation protease
VRVHVIGLGNDHRGDDAAGLAAARRLQQRLAELAPAACVRAHGGEPVDLLHLWDGADLAVLIDAADDGGPAGRILRVAYGEDALPRGRRGASSHAFDLPLALELAERMDALPPRLVLYLLTGAGFAAGTPLAPEVEAALPELTDRVEVEVRAALSGAPEADGAGSARA